MAKKKFVLVDSNGLIHRAFHAYPPHLTTSDGTPINAVYGFTTMLLNVIKEFGPECLVCVFDAPGPTFRHKEFKEYKAQRKPMDDDLCVQIPLAKEIVNVFNIPLYEQKGFEADDIIGTIAKKNETKDFETIIVTGDHDLLQLVDNSTFVYMAGRTFQDSKLYKAAEVNERYGFGPDRIIDYKALKGDSSDNIPGVAGIGDKSAVALIQQFGDVESIYQHIEDTDTRVRKKLDTGKDMAFLSKQIATIATDVPIELSLEDCAWGGYKQKEVLGVFQKFQFRSLIPTLDKIALPSSSNKREDQTGTHQQKSTQIKELTTDTDLEDITKKIKKSTEVVLDILSDEKEHYLDKKIGWIGFRLDKELYVACRETFSAGVWETFIQKITQTKLICHNAKDHMHILANEGVKDVTFDFCCKIVSFLLFGSSEGKDLGQIGFNRYGILLEKKSLSDKDHISLRIQIITKLYDDLVSEFEKDENQNLKNLFNDIDLPLENVLFSMERTGIRMDVDYLTKIEEELGEQIDSLVVSIHEHAGYEFNINSSKQVGEVLFDKLNLSEFTKKTKTGAYSTNEQVLKKLKDSHPIIDDLLAYRELSKLRSTYTKTLIKLVREDGRIHSTFDQSIAATGRLSSNNPNLQNIPVSSEWGRKVREAFVAQDGKTFMAFDVSQQELRLLAHFSEEPKLIESFKKGIDVHIRTASEILNIPLNKVTKRDRRVGKVLNFGIIYGMSGFALSEMLSIPRSDGDELIEKYFKQYPKVAEFFDHYLQAAKHNKYVSTLLGRRRETMGLTSTNFHLREATKREVRNFPLQGTAADLMRKSMVELGNISSPKLDPKLILQIHDELIFECKDGGKKNLKDFKDIVIGRMEGVYELKVPLKIECKIGPNLSALE